MVELFYIIDVRENFRRNPYITLWRSKDSGYAYPLPWAGKYTRAQVDSHPDYYYTVRFGSTRILDRYPVPCEAVEALGVEPARGAIDGDAGPVIRNTRAVRDALRKHRYVPAQATGK